jgi:hypothetical protein
MYATIAIWKIGRLDGGDAKLTTEAIIALISKHYGIVPDELGGGGKQPIRSEARAAASLLVREEQKQTFTLTLLSLTPISFCPTTRKLRIIKP